MAAQAFLHSSSKHRRSVAVGGNLSEPLADIRHGDTLRSLAVDIRMAMYDSAVARKNQVGPKRREKICKEMERNGMKLISSPTECFGPGEEWARLGAGLTFERAVAADLRGYEDLLGRASHIHGLDKPTFWGLWHAAQRSPDKAERLPKALKDLP